MPILLVQIEYDPDIEPLSFRTRRFYISNFEVDNFQSFQTDFGADCL